ncbi:hypothetical protein ABW19_dt0203991 [Dactylella cylindrospora]|nr:hypothetical protein ABW19_dt0203991 [Dactylella cylindrospora]
MAAEMCTVLPANPLPLDPASAEDAYELIKENILPAAVKELLDSVDSFVGRQLAQQDRNANRKCFCSYHSDLVNSSSNPKELEDMWILQRDISVQLFKVMMGVVRSAADLARRVRYFGKNTVQNSGSALDDLDLELAFTGDARGGYQWLNCLAKDECEWVWAAINDDDESLESLCPACLLGRAIDSESTIRLLITAARMLKWDFFVASIQEHLASDPWWGPGYWETIEPKANILEDQIRDLLQQCSSLRDQLKESNATRSQLVRASSNPARRAVTYDTVLDRQYFTNSLTSIPMKLDLRQLHQLVDILTIDTSRNGRGVIEGVVEGALRPYNHARMANNQRLTAYCWFVLMYNMSLVPSGAPSSPRDPRTSRTKMRSKTV